MPRYAEMSKAELEAELAEVRALYGEMAARGLKLNTVSYTHLQRGT